MLVLAVALAGCSQTTTSAYAPDLALSTPLAHMAEGDTLSAAVSHFQDLCLRPAMSPAEGKALALRLGWREVGDDELVKAGLQRLRKAILEVPGGGARIREEQEIVTRDAVESDEDKALLIAAFDRRLAGNETRSTQCTVYLQGDYLKTCETLGKVADRAPDRNHRYPQRDAHFIQWTIRLDGREAILNCSRTPQSVLLPYDGVTLSVHADHSGTARKTAFKPVAVRSSQPAVDG